MIFLLYKMKTFTFVRNKFILGKLSRRGRQHRAIRDGADIS